MPPACVYPRGMAMAKSQKSTVKLLLVMVALVLFESARQWIGVLSGRREARVKETPFVMSRLSEEHA